MRNIFKKLLIFSTFIFIFPTLSLADYITFSKCVLKRELLNDIKIKEEMKDISSLKWRKEFWDRQNVLLMWQQKLDNYIPNKNSIPTWRHSENEINEFVKSGYVRVKKYEKRTFSINKKTGIITKLILYTDEFSDIDYKNQESYSLLNESKYQGVRFKELTTKYKITSYADNILIAEELVKENISGYWTPSKLIVDLSQNTINANIKQISRIDKFLCENKKNNNEAASGISSSGSAFFINHKGNLVTNHHVIEGCKELNISYFDKEYKAKILHSDKNLDLAVLKADVRPKNYISVSKNPPKKLQNIFAAGYPLGKGLSDDLKITSGIISSIKGFKDNVNEIQIDAAINSGNSGGPIVSEDGYLVGISVSGLDKSKTESVNFGIKASSLEQFLNVNEIKYSKPFYEFSSSKDSLRKLLENSTVYISCKS